MKVRVMRTVVWATEYALSVSEIFEMVGDIAHEDGGCSENKDVAGKRRKNASEAIILESDLSSSAESSFFVSA
jgi:hypothetical protein